MIDNFNMGINTLRQNGHYVAEDFQMCFYAIYCILMQISPNFAP